MTASKWPAYPTADPDSIYALGVASIEFVGLESALIFIFATGLNISHDLAKMIHARSGNEACVRLIEQMMPPLSFIGPLPREVLEVRYFIEGFQRCAENRNHLMHSEFSPFSGSAGAMLIKTSKQGQTILSLQPLPKLRQVADDMRAYERYGIALGNAINASAGGIGGFFPWPDRPAPPHKLEYTADPIPE
jgi:hypothetical protein